MTLDDYFNAPGPIRPTEADWLWEADALLEADLLDIRQRLYPKTLGLLIDLRQAEIREGNTAALIVRDVTAMHWDDQTRRIDRLAWKIMGSRTVVVGDHLSLVLDFIWPATLTVGGRTAEFYVGNVPGLTEAPPDYVADTDAVIEANEPSWKAAFELVTSAQRRATTT